MRESRTFAERTKVLKTDEAKKRYFLVFEGASTEKIYFEALENARDDVDIDPLIELVPIMRSYSEDGWSNPKKILDRIIANLAEEETGRLTYESLLNRIMDYLYDEKIITTSKVQAHALWGILKEGCEKILNKHMADIVDNLVEDCNKLTEYLNQESDVVNIVDDISDIIRASNLTYDSRFD
ncbi:MAG: RloB family protein, partial [Butyrivibrio sp.]|nr:RloB family protein [Butyrivibrio sp.]